ncbi:D-inositol-3-phosphate glycosyltransferase [Saliniradius amylolyticus]|uniref:D-inositol-3-phosphate glycosyltransferase n=1 Tax=Saliniradius amylolyticus TaxID=2183582 RepID=A0A2S2E235_9ALTE|nr:glycosyltransferase [Saliniradius amylolyticus]AWL11659.1 D-inositol-3-phosphate glycosyltransferase [Saliniradius amylolyticus]
MFNQQQFKQLEQDYELYFLIPVAFADWLAHAFMVGKSSHYRLVPYFYTPKIGRRWYGRFMYWSLWLWGRRWLQRIRPQKVLATWAYPDVVAAAPIARRLNAEFYFKVHGSDINIHAQDKHRARQILAAADEAQGIVAVSEALKTKMVSMGIQEDKIHVIYNGVDHSLFSEPKEPPIKRNYFLYVGNLKAAKGVMELLEGFARLSVDPEEPMKLVYLGGGPMLGRLKERARKLGVAGRVEFAGVVPHKALGPWMQHAKAVVLPSYHEGVPNVVLEAMAAGVPVVATEVGGIPEVLDRELCGLLIPPQDAAAVAKALQGVLKHSWSSEAIKAYSQRFSWQENRKGLLELLNTSSGDNSETQGQGDDISA